MSAARTAYPSTVERGNPGSGCGAVTGSPGTRRSARCSGTVSVLVRRSGRKPARASATVRVVKNSREAASAMVLPARRSTLITGPSATWPSPQIEVRRITSSRSRTSPSTSAGPPPAPSSPSRMTCALAEPTRHGTHLPHDSSRKNRRTLYCRGEQVGAFGHDHDRAGPEHGARLLQRAEVQFHVQLVRPDEVGGRAARLDGAEAPAARHPAGQVEQLTGGGAHRDAVHAGPFHVARDGEELQARMVAPRPARSTTARPGRR